MRHAIDLQSKSSARSEQGRQMPGNQGFSGQKSRPWGLKIAIALTLAILTVGLIPVADAQAAGSVRLELVGDPMGGGAMEFQNWMRILSSAGIENVRIRSSRGGGDQIGIEKIGTAARPIYVVTGKIDGGRIVLPFGRFGQGDARRLAAALEDLASQGTEEERPVLGPFGLNEAQVGEITRIFSKQISVLTKDQQRGRIVYKIVQGMLRPPTIPNETYRALGLEPIETELVGVSTGTALAYLLRPMGFVIVPQPRGADVTFKIIPSQPNMQVWPVGWTPEKPLPQVLPSMYETHNIAVGGVPADKVIAAVAGKADVPVLYDLNAMARHGIEPSQKLVKYPQSKTMYGIALRRMLYQAGLKYEIRVDENGKPFLWITTLKPV